MVAIQNRRPISNDDSNSTTLTLGDVEQEEIPTVTLSLENSIQDLDIFSVSTEPVNKLLSSYPDLPPGKVDITVVRVESAASHSFLPQIVSPLLRQPAFTSATVHKKSEASMLGIGFKKVDGRLHVSSIRPNCLLSKSPFQLGDKLISINSVDCANKSLSHVAKMLKTATGLLTVVMEHTGGDPMLVESMIIKESPNTRTGLGVSSSGGWCCNNNGGISVCSIDSKGIFASSLLSPQDRILSINGIDCRFLPVRQAAGIITKATDSVTIVAKKGTDNAAVVLLAASA